ncbi:MAG: GMP synthase subunit A [Thermoplasmata archaeon]|nr:GMP synthase subunit A [Thermoplasmata archaeon]
MRISVVDNGGQWTHREWRLLREIGVEADIIPNTTPMEGIAADALILSGGAPRISFEVPKLGITGDYLDQLDIPILGICVGHQFLALHFDGKVGPAEVPEYGKTLVFVDEANDLFDGIPAEFQAWESHNDEIKALTPDFIPLAHSRNCAIQAMKYRKKAFYGVQFHPEVTHTNYGREIFENFIRLARI